MSALALEFRVPTAARSGEVLGAIWDYDALRMEIAAAGTDHKALRRVARTLLEKAANGDTAAIIALVDRLDGKVPLPTGQSDELGPRRLQISWKNEPASEVEPPSRLALAHACESGDAAVDRPNVLE